MTNNSLQIEYLRITELRDNARSARRHSKTKVAQLADSIGRLGFNVPLIVDRDGTLLAGHARLAAAKLVGMDEVPVVRVTHLSEVEARGFMLADNKFGLNASWDFEVLANELKELVDVGFDAVRAGFAEAEIDLTICNAEQAKAIKSARSPANLIPPPPDVPVTRTGDIWLLGRHKLLCGDARDPTAYKRLLAGETADTVFTDPPYNVPIPGHVSGLGKVKRVTPGTRFVREWRGKIHVVTVSDEGCYRWQNRDGNSLSEIARTITGTQWSGPAFFGTKPRRKRAA